LSVNQSLSCCLVVRNESSKIVNCLDNIKILADEIIVIDTGSTDNTPSIIKQWAIKNKIERNVNVIEVGKKFHDEDDDFNFGAAKTFAFDNASKDFVMWLDANDTVTNQAQVKKIFLVETSKNPNMYFALPTALTADYAFARVRIAPRGKVWMEGSVHEYMRFSDNSLVRFFIPIAIQNKKPGRDLNRNLRLLLKEWNRSPTARMAFYIAQSYSEMGNDVEAFKWYKKRIFTFEFLHEFGEEHFKSMECFAEYLASGKKYENTSDTDLYDIATEMIRMEPTRIEGYYYLGKYHMTKKEYDKAINEFRKYTICKKPAMYNLWLDKRLYGGRAIRNAIDECSMGLKYKDVLKPEQILDYGPTSGGYKVGSAQY